MKYSRDELVTKLHNGPCIVTFTKVNGEKRIMPCTLHPMLLPPVTVVEQVEGKVVKERKENLDTIRVYCTDKLEWRSFRVDSVLDFVGRSLI